MRIFAVCQPGLEPLIRQELGKLGLFPQGSEETGGIEFDGSLSDLYRCNLHLRTASRILIRLGSFYASGFPELKRKVSRLPWEEYLTPSRSMDIRVACHQSRLYHQRAVAERISEAISDRMTKSNPPSPPFNKGGKTDVSKTSRQLILVRISDNQCTISIDSSGELLHRRGYRLATAKAPLRETLAAVMILASGWDGISPLLDPFCGSGTIAIEAALMSPKIPPGQSRHFAFMDWPGFDRNIWESLLSDIPRNQSAPLPKILASDRDAGAIRAAQANAERAGVADSIEFSCRAVSSIEPPPEQGWIVSNPPYGVRTESNRDLRNLYAQFGKVLRSKCPGWQVTLLCGSDQLLHSTGLQFDQEISLTNGGVKVKMVRGKIKG